MKRLKQKKQITQLFSRGHTLTVPGLRMLWMKTENTDDAVRVGFTVPKTQFKNAVTRNRIRRLMRESYRLNKQKLTAMIKDGKPPVVVMFIYTGKKVPLFAEMQDKIVLLLHRLSQVYA